MNKQPRVDMVPTVRTYWVVTTFDGQRKVRETTWHYRLIAANGEIVVHSEQLTKKAHCRKQAKALAAGMTNGRGFIHELNGTVIPL